MPPFTYEPAALANVSTVQPYLDSLSAPIDSFLEDHIAQSAFQRILVDGHVAGHFAVYDGDLLTQFYLTGAHQHHGSFLLRDIRGTVQPSVQSLKAFVPTCDEFFLSHCVEEYARLHVQACFFVEADPQTPLPNAIVDVHYRLAEQSDVAAIEQLSGDFLDKHALRIVDAQLHVGHLGAELVAIGVMERSRFTPDQASIGMFTGQAHRRRGIGVGTLLYLRGICHTQGVRPVAGCGYGNTLSRRTLEAAGMATQTRLLRFEW